MNFALSELAARRIVSQESCVQRICELVPGALSAQRLPSAITRHILRPICYRKPGLLQLHGAQLVSDITYIPTREGWLFLAVVIDLFSRAILGSKLSDSLHADLVVGATTRAIESGFVPRGAIFHSDRGCQYSATITRELLARHGLRQSMSAKGYCYDNAFSESAFASLKSEVLSDGLPFDSKRAATIALFDYFETFYNRRRLHSSLGYLSPNAFLNSHFQNQNPHLN